MFRQARRPWRFIGLVAAALLSLLGLCFLVMYLVRETQLEGKSLVAAEEFYRAKDREAKVRVADRYQHLPLSAIWLLRLAFADSQNGAILQAADLFARFLERYPGHELFPAAEIGRANCLRLERKVQEAEKFYREVLRQNRLSVYQELAYVGLARLQEDMGNPQEARKTLEQFLSRFPSSRLQDMAQAILDRLPSVPTEGKKPLP
ncbi:tetratricopeptide repeat protein [Candidatus Methylacidithermus pantelleriae]|uniref:Cellulose synthase operon protein C n=1 Tax=Candidatus Methylacidithermus pantelleriae TaxID=2744239 RepID=A0A8J2BLZ2_9BACT|nr:tetratricopeptide repeat protein [Candidatus Methylacidithermus pantelleriae]CAF0688963.1 Cellulose synthase operon protein C [Candidatus Methylacidithermus pantelleriae]